ncbi:MAG: hypothetical protein KBC43_11275 [Bacteroidales bacterium]|nr:hypothetical protein [Bacteroidales bacterium]
MKNINSYQVRILFASFILYLLPFLSINTIYAQDFSHVENIKVPSTANSGYPIGDIIAANNRLFLYSTEGIVYFNPSDNPIVYGFINFPGYFGKFNPVLNRGGGHDANMMTLNSTDNLLYVITPDLKILKISTTNPGFTGSIMMGTPGDITHFQTLNGYNVIKYDGANDRLYWLVEGRNESNETGEFHYRDTYLAVYNVSPDGNSLSYINSLFYIGHGAGQYMESIFDVEFNETNDYFYLAKKRHLEVWQIDNQTNTFNLVNTIKTLAGKFGKLLYINNGTQIHKILAFPYRLPFTGSGFEYEPPLESEIRFFSIDGNNPFQVDSILAPSKRINDAVYLSGYNDLVLCYAPDEYIQDYVVRENSDVALYHFSGNSFSFTGDLITNGFPQYNEPEQLMNRPNQMFANTNSSIITGKTHEIVRIFKNNGTYTFSQLLSGESNCFSKTAQLSARDYIINPTLNGLVVYNESLPNEDLSFIRTAYPVYNICANPLNGNLYFSNRLSSEHCGFYIYHPSTGVSTHINQYSSGAFTKPIGDLIFNEFTGQYLVSENAPDEINNHVHVKVFNGQTDQVAQIINVPGQYAKEMFISPQGWLYIMFDMHAGLDPKILILNARDYTGNTVITLNPGGYQDPFAFYTAEFLYNPKNRTVYLTVSPNAITLEPYNPVINSMRDYIGSINLQNGLLIELYANQFVRSFPLHFPGKMICPDAESSEYSANYQGKLFIKTNSLSIYQYDNPTIPKPGPESVQGNPKYNEIVYSAYYDTVYGLRDEIDDETFYPADREINIYKIFSDGTSELKFQYPGQAAAFFNNPYDTLLYLFVKIDDIKLGDTPASLLQLNPKDSTFFKDIIDVDNTAFYIEYDHNPDYGFHFYNMINPYIDRYSNQIYLPNGGHGNVSVLSYKAEESYTLGSGIKWLSFPRLTRNAGEVEPAEALLNRIEVPPFYDDGKMSTLVPNSDNLLYIEYDPLPGWYHSIGQLSMVHSSLGYKIDYLIPEADRKIIMEGDVWEPDEYVIMYPRYENWVGYWLPEVQSPFDAIPQSILDELTSIKGQYWTCGKFWGSTGDGPGQPQPSYWLCACTKGGINLRYGDMAVLKTIDLTGPSYDFQWQRYGNPVMEEPKPETEFYSFTEKSDYTPYFIELDTTDLPLEIAAFVNDTCVGATTVLPGDSLILVPGYTGGLNGEVVFEQYFGPEKSQPVLKEEYFVYNHSTGRKEKRTIHSIESQGYFRISFRNNESGNGPIKEEAWIRCQPNPVKDNLEIRFYTPEEGAVNIMLNDLFGRMILTVYDGYAGKGEICIPSRSSVIKEGRLAPGVYCLVLNTGSFKAETKVIIINN